MNLRAELPERFAPSHRAVVGLRWAELSSKAPWPRLRRRKGAKARGLAYERKLGLFLSKKYPSATHLGEWFHFLDANGSGYAQPDAYVVFPSLVVAFECKLTQTVRAELQLRELYLPLLAHVYSRPVVGVQVCKYLVAEPGERLIKGPEAAFAKGDLTIWTWHWLGV